MKHHTSEKEDDCLVTVRCIAYNHEPYIRQCLDGFVMQKTNFKFEAIVHDDASTDNTASIIREYAEQYPDIIKPIYETENQYSKNDGSLRRIMDEHTYGKYVALCEGDDYWTDPLKLQKQVDFLEANSECTLYVSNGFGYIEAEKRTIILNSIPTKESKFLTMHEVLIEKNGLIPTASMLFRREMYETEPDWCLNAPVGDRPLRMWCAINGKIYYDVTPMVTYRKGSIGSFTQRVKNVNYARHIYDDMCVFFDAFDEYTHKKYHSEVQYMKDREEHYYYRRIGDISSALNSNFFKRYSYKKQVFLRLKYKFPNLYKLYQKVKKKG